MQIIINNNVIYKVVNIYYVFYNEITLIIINKCVSWETDRITCIINYFLFFKLYFQINIQRIVSDFYILLIRLLKIPS